MLASTERSVVRSRRGGPSPMDGRAPTGVVGGGTMGAGIAHVLLAAGSPVTVVEADQGRADATRDAVRSSLEGAAERGKLDVGVDDLVARLTVGTAVEGLPDD